MQQRNSKKLSTIHHRFTICICRDRSDVLKKKKTMTLGKPRHFVSLVLSDEIGDAMNKCGPTVAETLMKDAVSFKSWLSYQHRHCCALG